MLAADILAGPILRRVEHDLVSVWIALNQSAKVDLQIFRGMGPVGSLGPEIARKAPTNARDTNTLAAGKGLHIAVAVWEPDSVAGLDWGGLYSYDVRITPAAGGGTVGLQDLGLLTDTTIHAHNTDHKHLALGYQPNYLPSFALPPPRLADLKIVQGSCRGSNGEGRDALPPLDDWLAAKVTLAAERPHMMFLTGDQVYSDEGAPELVEMLQTLTGELLEGTPGASVETIRIEFPKTATDDAMAFDVPTDTYHLPPGRRAHVMLDVACFTSDHTDSHAMGFGEYCANYLTGWCNICWDWDALKKMGERGSRFTDYVNARKGTMAKIGASYQEPGIPDSVEALQQMASYYHAWRLVPDAYRQIDANLTVADVQTAWGKDDAKEPGDVHHYNLWNNFAAAASLSPPLPVYQAPAPPPAAPATPLTAPQLNRLAKTLTPTWWAGEKYFGCEFDKPADLDPAGDLVYNRIHRLEWFYQDLPKVRRLLANIPTYLVFDDHEITDDWNITPRWAKRTRGNALGRAVVRNGLAAFTLFQYWGNDPRACRKVEGSMASLVLDTIEQLFAPAAPKPGPDPGAAGGLETLFDLTLVNPPKPDQRMWWHFRYDGPKFEVLALDSRTWRGFEPEANDLLKEPFFDDATATLLTYEAMVLQVPEQPAAGVNPDGFCIVIAAAPFLGFPPAESMVQPLLNLEEMIFREPKPPFQRWGRSVLVGRVQHDPETWGFRPRLFEAMLARLASRSRVIFFSGDVHYSFASHMDYWRLNPDGTAQASTRFVQLTASSMRAQQPRIPSIFSMDVLQQLGALASKASRYGWNRGAAGTPQAKPPVVEGTQKFSQHLDQSLLDDPILVSPDGIPSDGAIVRMPDWQWKMDLDSDSRADTVRFTAPPPPAFLANGAQADVVQAVARRHVWQARYSMSRRWHWWTNFTTVAFQPAPDGSPGTVVFSVYSYDPDGVQATAEPFMITNVDLTVQTTAPKVTVKGST